MKRHQVLLQRSLRLEVVRLREAMWAGDPYLLKVSGDFSNY